VIVAGMNLINYDTMAIGPKELSLGLDLLRRRIAEAEFPMLSANVVLSGTQELLAPPYILLEAGGRQVGVIGLTRQPEPVGAGVMVLDPQQAAARYVPEVAARADTIVILTNLNHLAAQALAQAVPGIDLVVAAIPEQHPTQSLRVSGTGTLVVVADLATTGHSGRRVGVLDSTLAADGSLTGERWQSLWLGSTVADDPAMDALLEKYR